MANMSFIYKFFLCYLIVADLLFYTVTAKVNKELIKKVNQMRTSWRAGVNRARIPRRFSPRNRKKTVNPGFRPPLKRPLTRFFDARTHWPQCESVLLRIRDQGFCNSGWAVATASVMSDRVCIHTNASMQLHFSAHELMSCCKNCLLNNRPPCEGGDGFAAMAYFTLQGLVTGGEVGSREGCKPYGRKFYDGFNDKCVEACTNPFYNATYEEDKVQAESVYHVPADEEQIRQEVYNYGPVLAEIIVYEDLIYYKSGVYRHVLGDDLGMHYLKIIGWGDRDAQRYWTVVNSLGMSFGLDGTMRFLRGVNHSGIEGCVLTTRDILLVISPDAREAGVRVSQASAVRPYRPESVCADVILVYIFCICTYEVIL